MIIRVKKRKNLGKLSYLCSVELKSDKDYSKDNGKGQCDNHHQGE